MYLDDIIVLGKTFEDHWLSLEKRRGCTKLLTTKQIYPVITSSKLPLITLVVVAKHFYIYPQELTLSHIHFSLEQFVCKITYPIMLVETDNFKSLL